MGTEEDQKAMHNNKNLVEEDEASSSSSSSSFNSIKENSPLYELSDLMANLPIKRGLSKFYQGKSQSFASLKRVTSLDDLAKKENPFRRRKIKPCKSYGACLGTTLPKSAISKKKKRAARRGSWESNPSDIEAFVAVGNPILAILKLSWRYSCTVLEPA
ncbi:hypothetical protein ACFE04_003967 [Oxalis oulophora]